jgi:hypothetical protein
MLVQHDIGWKQGNQKTYQDEKLGTKKILRLILGTYVPSM